MKALDLIGNKTNSSNSKSFNESKKSSNKETIFADRVIHEFDKILESEYKRIEKYFNRTEFIAKRKSVLTKNITNSNQMHTKEKIEYKPLSSTDTWLGTLRGKLIKEENLEFDLEKSANLSKKKIRSSIKVDNFDTFLNLKPEFNNISKFDEQNSIKNSNSVGSLKYTRQSPPPNIRITKLDKQREYY